MAEQKTPEQIAADTAAATAAADALKASEEAKQAAAKKAAEAKPEGKPEPLAPNWAINRIDALTRQKRDLEERLISAKQNPQQLPQQRQTPQQKQQQQQTPEQIKAAEDARVEQRVAEQRFGEACNKLYTDGNGEFDDFDQVLSTYKTIGGLSPTAVQSAIEIGDAHKILYKLARDPNEAYRVMNLPPAAQAAALAKLAIGTAAKKGTISKAKPPVGAIVDGKGDDTRTNTEKLTDPNTSMDDWVKIRQAQRAKRAEERQASRQAMRR